MRKRELLEILKIMVGNGHWGGVSAAIDPPE
jgi:hypothetical protein